MITLNDIKEAIEYTEYGHKYKNFFITLSNESKSTNKTYSLLTTNRKCVEFLLDYYSISSLDMEMLFNRVSNDPNIKDTNSSLFEKLSNIVNGTWASGERTEEIVVKNLEKNPYIKSVKRTGGLGSKRDMIDKVDIEITLTSGKQLNVQVKPWNEKITKKDRMSKADVFAFVSENKIRYEEKEKRNI
jgi:hypothetical protein